MDVNAEIANQKNIIAEAMKEKRRLKRQRKELSAEIRGWDDSMEKASQLVELLEAGDVDGYQQTLASAIKDGEDE